MDSISRILAVHYREFHPRHLYRGTDPWMSDNDLWLGLSLQIQALLSRMTKLSGVSDPEFILLSGHSLYRELISDDRFMDMIDRYPDYYNLSIEEELSLREYDGIVFIDFGEEMTFQQLGSVVHFTLVEQLVLPI